MAETELAVPAAATIQTQPAVCVASKTQPEVAVPLAATLQSKTALPVAATMQTEVVVPVAVTTQPEVSVPVAAITHTEVAVPVAVPEVAVPEVAAPDTDYLGYGYAGLVVVGALVGFKKGKKPPLNVLQAGYMAVAGICMAGALHDQDPLYNATFVHLGATAVMGLLLAVKRAFVPFGPLMGLGAGMTGRYAYMDMFKNEDDTEEQT